MVSSESVVSSLLSWHGLQEARERKRGNCSPRFLSLIHLSQNRKAAFTPTPTHTHTHLTTRPELSHSHTHTHTHTHLNQDYTRALGFCISVVTMNVQQNWI